MKACEFCGKGHYMGGTRKLLRGHYNPTNWKRKHANLQWFSIPGKDGRVKACVKCIKLKKGKLDKSTKKSTK